MFKTTKQNNFNEYALFNSILLLSRNKIFYTKFNLSDIFHNRIHLIFVHISFIFIKIKQYKDKNQYKLFYQKTFDSMFKNIDLNMREIGYGDTTINKNMKFLVKNFYNILLYCENFDEKNIESKNIFFTKYLIYKDYEKKPDNKPLIRYFDKYETFCIDLSSDRVLKGEINFNYK